MQLISVVLPAPFGPISPVTFPGCVAKFTPERACKSAKMPRNVGQFKQGKSL